MWKMPSCNSIWAWLPGRQDTFTGKNHCHHLNVAEESSHRREGMSSPPLRMLLPSSLLILILPHSAFKCLTLRCRIVTINLNDAAPMKVLFVGCESELTPSVVLPPSASPGAHYFFLSFLLQMERNWFRATVKQLLEIIMICLGIDHCPSGALKAEQQPHRLRSVLIDPSFSEAPALMRAQEVLGFTYITLPPLGKKRHSQEAYLLDGVRTAYCIYMRAGDE